jgi:Xaa-Pro aminopeptidase
MTRTVALGEVSRELREVYEAVLEAQQAALEAVRPGRTGQQLDAIARQVLQARGYGEYFAHGLGHGVGLAIHEGPRLSKLSEDVLEAGMVLTIEPGVYIPGVGGCRIEDLVLVTETGYEVLSHSPKGFSVL